MKASWKVGAKVVVEADGESVKQVFERLGDLAACLGADSKCGCCGSDALAPHVKRPQNYVYYSLLCQACGAELAFGQTKEGERLFPKRDKGKNGWEVYSGNRDSQHQPEPATRGGRDEHYQGSQQGENIPY